MKLLIALTIILFFQNSIVKKVIFLVMKILSQGMVQRCKIWTFIHWGVYSVLGDGEWVMNNQNISIEEYEKLPSFFNPVYFDAEEWVLMAKDAGMKYIT